MKTVKLPAQGTVFDYYLDPLSRRFLPWSDRVPTFNMEPDTPLQVRTVQLYPNGEETTHYTLDFLHVLKSYNFPKMIKIHVAGSNLHLKTITINEQCSHIINVRTHQ